MSAEVGAHRGEDHEQRGLVSRAQAQGRLRAYHGDGDGDDDDTNYDDDDDDDDDLRTDHGGPDVEGGVGGPRHPVLVHQDQPAGGRSQVFRYGYYLGYSTVLKCQRRKWRLPFPHLLMHSSRWSELKVGRQDLVMVTMMVVSNI